MTHDEFEKLVAVHKLGGESVEACRRVLVEGRSQYAVAMEMQLAQSTVSRALRKLARPICEKCHQPTRGKH